LRELLHRDFHRNLIAGQTERREVLALPVANPPGAAASPPPTGLVLGDDVDTVAAAALDLKPVLILVVVRQSD
jgi:hypothetical protein